MSHYLLLDSVNVSADENSTDLPKLEEIIINLDNITVIKRSCDLMVGDQDEMQHVSEELDEEELDESEKLVIVLNDQTTIAFEGKIAKINYFKIVKKLIALDALIPLEGDAYSKDGKLDSSEWLTDDNSIDTL